MFQVKLSLAGSNSENYLPLPYKEPKSHREELCINSGSRLAFPAMDLVVFFLAMSQNKKIPKQIFRCYNDNRYSLFTYIYYTNIFVSSYYKSYVVSTVNT